MSVESTPMQPFDVTISAEPWPKTSTVFRAYYADGVPMYMAEFTRQALVSRVMSLHPLARILP